MLMKLATSTGMHGGEYLDRMTEYEAISAGGFKYVNFNFDNFAFQHPSNFIGYRIFRLFHF